MIANTMINSLVEELQRVALDDKQPLVSLIRKALVLAIKLDVKDLQRWCQLEMNGYGDDKDDMPLYRQVEGSLVVKDGYGRYQPIRGMDPKVLDWAKRRSIAQPVSQLEDLLRECEREPKTRIVVPLPHEALELIFGGENWYQDGLLPQVAIQRSHLVGLLDGIRTQVLSWSLELEKLGINGEGMSFSKDEAQKAQNHGFHISTGQGGDVNLVIGSSVSGDLQIGRNWSFKKNDLLEDVRLNLIRLVKELQSSLTPEEAERVARDHESFVKEISSSAPREKWYTVTGEGLMEAAEAVTTFPAKVLREYIDLGIKYARLRSTDT